MSDGATGEIGAAVQAALDADARPFIRAHAGDVEVAAVSEAGDIHVRFLGACCSCPALASTFVSRVAPVVAGVPGVRGVVAEGVNVSAHALRRLAQMSGVVDVSTGSVPVAVTEGTM